MIGAAARVVLYWPTGQSGQSGSPKMWACCPAVALLYITHHLILIIIGMHARHSPAPSPSSPLASGRVPAIARSSSSIFGLPKSRSAHNSSKCATSSAATPS